MMKQIFLSITRNYSKLMPLAAFALLAVLALKTDLLSSDVREVLQAGFADYFLALKPYVINFIFAAVLANLSWVFYRPACKGIESVLSRGEASERGRSLSIKLFKFAYWAVVVFLVLTITASEILSRFVLGFGVFGAALTLSMQGVANDFICGVLIQITNKVSEGVEIKIEGLDVQGKVTFVGYLSTSIESSKAVVHMPNREIWARAIKVLKPTKSILLPPGFDNGRAIQKSGDSK